MTSWLRWYCGTCEDVKFRMVASTAGVSISTAIAVWAVLLEDAAHDSHRGIVQRNEDWVGTILDLKPGVAEAVLSAMQDVGLVSVGIGAITVINWGKRQFESDLDSTATVRQRRRRERLKSSKQEASHVTGVSRVSHGSVTRDSRVSHGRVTHPETETETDKKDPVATLPRAEPAMSPLDVKKALWDSAIPFLKANGVSEDRARTLLGSWRKNHPDVAIVNALAAAQAAGTPDPISYVKAALAGKAKTDERTRGNANGKRHNTTEGDIAAFNRAMAGWQANRPVPRQTGGLSAMPNATGDRRSTSGTDGDPD